MRRMLASFTRKTYETRATKGAVPPAGGGTGDVHIEVNETRGIKTDEDAAEMARDLNRWWTEYGKSASQASSDPAEADRLARRVKRQRLANLILTIAFPIIALVLLVWWKVFA